MSAAEVIVDLHAELAAEALDGISWQAAAASRFLHRGEYQQALEAYRHVLRTLREFAQPDMQVIAGSLQAVEQPAAESAEVSPPELAAT